MPAGRRAHALLSLFLISLTLAGSTACLARRRVITRKGIPSTQKLLEANKEALVARLRQNYEALTSINATIDMVPALGSADKGRITEYKDVRAYVLFRKPELIRLIGLYPVVRNRAFDMVSDGERFRLFIPAKNRFITGRNELAEPSPNRLENLRPQHFIEALLIRPIDPARERAVLLNITDEDAAHYVLLTVEVLASGQVRPLRQMWFDRGNLALDRQILFDAGGDILTDARYSEWKTYNRVPFPAHVEINRPRDEYGVVMTVVKMEMNTPLGDDKFVLEQPEGTELRVLGEKPAASPATVRLRRESQTK